MSFQTAGDVIDGVQALIDAKLRDEPSTLVAV